MSENLSMIVDVLLSVSLLIYFISSQKEIKLLKKQNDMLVKAYKLAGEMYKSEIDILKNEEEVGKHET